jgi:hypothetical protein
MMGTLAASLAGRQIPTFKENYWVDVEGDIENVDNVLKITRIRAKYHIKVPRGKTADAQEALRSYIRGCPAAQSVIGCIDIRDEAVIEEMPE